MHKKTGPCYGQVVEKHKYHPQATGLIKKAFCGGSPAAKGFLLIGDLTDEDAVVATAGGAHLPALGVVLHPFGIENIPYLVGKGLTAEVAQSSTPFGHGYSFAFAHNAHFDRVEFADKQGRSVTEHMAVIVRFSGVDQPKPSTAHQPVLLGVVVAQVFAIRKAKLYGIVKMYAVLAFGYEARYIIVR